MWTHRGISGKYELSCIGTKAGAVTVIGGARCVWDDLGRLNMRDRGDIMVVNDIGMYLDWPIDHWVSLHKIDLKNWLRLRRSHSMAFGHKFESHTQESYDGITNAWYLDDPMPYSGMFAVQVALALGYERITLCGIPQDGQANFFTPPWVTKTHADSNAVIKRLADKNGEFKRCARSMSGITREWFGAPNE